MLGAQQKAAPPKKRGLFENWLPRKVKGKGYIVQKALAFLLVVGSTGESLLSPPLIGALVIEAVD